MKKYLITFRSITPAQRAQRLLRTKGIHTALQRTPRWMEDRGCGYSLRLKFENGQQALRLLREENLPFRKIYLEEDGRVEEMP